MKLKRRGGTAVAAALLISAIVGPATVQADPPDDGIAFTRRLDTGGADVFVTRPDGTGTVHVPLSYPVEDFGLPVWSPDGGRLLISHVFRFDENGDFLPFRPVIVRPDGSNETLLEIPDGPFDMFCATWASAARLLCAFGDDADGVYSVRASDGGDARLLWRNAAGQRDLPFDLSPDGSRFLFIRFRAGPPSTPQQDRTQKVALYVANIDGTGIRQIVPFGIAQGHELAAAHWSPDGKSIISSTSQGTAVHHGRRSAEDLADQAGRRHDQVLRVRTRLVAGRLADRIRDVRRWRRRSLHGEPRWFPRDPDHGHARVRERSGLGP